MLVTVIALAPAFAAPPATSEIELAVNPEATDPAADVWARAIRTLRGIGEQPPTEAEVARAREALDRGLLMPPSQGALHLEGDFLLALRKAWGRSVLWSGRLTMAARPDGPIVLVGHPELPLQDGDIVLAVAQQPVTDLDDLLRLSPNERVRVRRGGQVLDLKATAPSPPDLDAVAPTCGPCCHGHCGDDIEPIAIPVTE